MKLDLVKIVDTHGHVTGIPGKITYQALTNDEFDNLSCLESDYSMIGREFHFERLGEVEIPSLEIDD